VLVVDVQMEVVNVAGDVVMIVAGVDLNLLYEKNIFYNYLIVMSEICVCV